MSKTKIMVVNNCIEYTNDSYDIINQDLQTYFSCAADMVAGKVDKVIILSSYGLENVHVSKLKGVVCAQISDEYTAVFSRKHNNANVATIPVRIVSKDYASYLIDLFLSTAYEGGRHNERLANLHKLGV